MANNEKFFDADDLKRVLQETNNITDLLEKSSSTFSTALSKLLGKTRDGVSTKDFNTDLENFKREITGSVEFLARQGKISSSYKEQAEEFNKSLEKIIRTFQEFKDLGSRINVDYLKELEQNVDRFFRNLGDDVNEFAKNIQLLSATVGTLGLEKDLKRPVKIEDIYKSQYLTRLVKQEKPTEGYYFLPNVENKVLQRLFGKKVEENIYSNSLSTFSSLLSTSRGLEQQMSLPSLLFTKRGREISDIRKGAVINTAESLNELKGNLLSQINDVKERLKSSSSTEEKAKLQTEELELQSKLLNVYKQEYEIIGEVVKNYRQLTSTLKDFSGKTLDRTYSLTRNPFVDIFTKSLKTGLDVGLSVYRASDSFFSNLPFFGSGSYSGPLTRGSKIPPTPINPNKPIKKYKITKPPEGVDVFPRPPLKSTTVIPKDNLISKPSNIFGSLGKYRIGGGLLSTLGLGIAAQGVSNYIATGNVGDAIKGTLNRNTLPGLIGGSLGSYAGLVGGASIGTALFPGLGTAVGGVLGSFLLGGAGANIGDKIGGILNKTTDSLSNFKDKINLSSLAMVQLPVLLFKSIQSVLKNPYAPVGGMFLKSGGGVGGYNPDYYKPTAPTNTINTSEANTNIFSNFLNFLKNGFSNLFNKTGLGKVVSGGAGLAAGALAFGTDFYLQSASTGYDLTYQRFVMSRMLPQFVREPYGNLANLTRQFVPGGAFQPKEMGFTSEEYLAQAARLSSSMIIKSSQDLSSALYNSAKVSNLFGTSLAEAGDLITQSRRAGLDERKAMQAAFISTGQYSGFSKAVAEGFIQASSSLAIRQNLNTQSYLTSVLSAQSIFTNSRNQNLRNLSLNNPELARTTFESFNQFIRSGIEGNPLSLGIGIRAGLTPRQMMMGATPENIQRVLSRVLVDTGISGSIVNGKILPGVRENLLPFLQQQLGFGNIAPDAFEELLVSAKQGKLSTTARDVIKKLNEPVQEAKTPDKEFSKQLDVLSTSNQMLVTVLEKNIKTITDLNVSINEASASVLNLSDKYVPQLINGVADLTKVIANTLGKSSTNSEFGNLANPNQVTTKPNVPYIPTPYNTVTNIMQQLQNGQHILLINGDISTVPTQQFIDNMNTKNKK
jgi:hypothetical protein